MTVMRKKIKDNEWLRQSFIFDTRGISQKTSELFKEISTFTTASNKFTDTTLGGNFCINPPPQFTRYADPKIIPLTKASKGQGRYYSEAIDDNGQRVTMRFGLPEFNSMDRFFTSFLDPGMAALARRGEAGGILYGVGRVVGMFLALPIYVLTFIPRVVSNIMSFITQRPRDRYYYLKPTMPLYWNSVQTMVNTLAVNMGLIPGDMATSYDDGGKAVFKGRRKKEAAMYSKILPSVYRDNGGINVYAMATRAQRLYHRDQERRALIAQTLETQEAMLKALEAHELNDPRDAKIRQSFFDYIANYSTIAMGSRSQATEEDIAAWNQQQRGGQQSGELDSTKAAVNANSGAVTNSSKNVQDMTSEEYAAHVKNPANTPQGTGVEIDAEATKKKQLQAAQDAQLADAQKYQTGYYGQTLAPSKPYYYNGVGNNKEQIMETYEKEQKLIAEQKAKEAATNTRSAFIGLSKGERTSIQADNEAASAFLEAERHDGAGWITFRVDYGGSVAESFSNSARESDIASTVNSASNTAKSSRFTFMDGNFTDGMLGNIVGAAQSIINGTLEGLNMSGLAVFAGAAFVDIPKHWDSSSCSLPRSDYTIELRSPYGNTLSRFQNLIVPLCMLLAGTLPLSTGPASFTSPFLCEMYAQGRSQIRLGIIDSLSITRGVGNCGFTKNNEPLGIDISFSVLDLSSIMHMPITPGNSPLDIITNLGRDTAARLIAEDSIFNDYMSVLSSLNMAEQVYVSDKFKRNWNKLSADWNEWFSVAHTANWAIGATTPGKILAAFARGTTRA